MNNRGRNSRDQLNIRSFVKSILQHQRSALHRTALLTSFSKSTCTMHWSQYCCKDNRVSEDRSFLSRRKISVKMVLVSHQTWYNYLFSNGEHSKPRWKWFNLTKLVTHDQATDDQAVQNRSGKSTRLYSRYFSRPQLLIRYLTVKLNALKYESGSELWRWIYWFSLTGTFG